MHVAWQKAIVVFLLLLTTQLYSTESGNTAGRFLDPTQVVTFTQEAPTNSKEVVMKVLVTASALATALLIAGIAFLISAPVAAAPACQSYKSPVQCEVGGKCVWTVSKGKPSKCLPIAKAKAPRRS